MEVLFYVLGFLESVYLGRFPSKVPSQADFRAAFGVDRMSDLPRGGKHDLRLVLEPSRAKNGNLAQAAFRLLTTLKLRPSIRLAAEIKVLDPDFPLSGKEAEEKLKALHDELHGEYWSRILALRSDIVEMRQELGKNAPPFVCVREDYNVRELPALHDALCEEHAALDAELSHLSVPQNCGTPLRSVRREA